VKIGITSSSNLWTNLAPHFKKMRGFSYFNQILLNLFNIFNIETEI